MKILVVIPIYNESLFLNDSLNSFVNQNFTIDKIIMVDDNSTDNSYQIAQRFALQHKNFQVTKNESSQRRQPGKKIIEAFNYGLNKCNLEDYDLIGKFDADIILPPHYFETLVKEFVTNDKLGLSSGRLYVYHKDKWIFENISSIDKVRGPIKLYRKQCFKDMKGLKNCIGWDTIDEFLVKYHNWEIKTVNLKVKHLRPTGSGYKKKDAMFFGESLHNLRYDILLACIAILKMSFKKKSIRFFVVAYLYFLQKTLFDSSNIISNKQAKYIRKKRWLQIKKKIINFY